MKKEILLGFVLIALVLSGCTQPSEEPPAAADAGEVPGAGKEPGTVTPVDFSDTAVIEELVSKVFEKINEKRQENYCPALELEETFDEALLVSGENIFTANLAAYSDLETVGEVAERIVEEIMEDEKNSKNALECGFEESFLEAELNARGDRLTVSQEFAGRYSTACFDEDLGKCERSSAEYYAIVNEEFYCETSHYTTSFGFELKNHGTADVPVDSVVKIILENDDSTFDYVREAVEPGKRFWQSMKSIVRTPPFEGRSFSLDAGTYGEELDLDYWLVYCYPGTRPKDCDVEEGRVLYTGNLLDCNAEVYEQPNTGAIIGLKS